MRRLAALTSAATAASGIAIGLAAAPQPAGIAGPQATAAGAPPSLVLVTLDTTRADHLGAYGYPHARTPNLDRLAARGVRFARADCPAPITLPSHASLLTGLLPPRHGVRDNGSFRLDDRFTTLAERLGERGYDAGALVSAVVLARRYGLDQGFRLWDEAFAPVAEGRAGEERNAAAATDAALRLLTRLRPPFFLWVHYFDPHADYRAPARLLTEQRGPHPAYDAEIAYVDEQLGRLLAALPVAAVVAVVGDHGEMLGEHGEATHGVLLHAGARRVPLILAGPAIPAGRVVDELVRTVDLVPTLLVLSGERVPGRPQPASGLDLDGASLLPLLAATGEPAASRVSYSESFQPLFAYRWYPLRALSDGAWLYVDAPRPRLFDLAADPGEGRDVAAARPAEAARWRRELASRLTAWGEVGRSPEPSSLSVEDRKRLATLGYLGGGGRAEDLAGLPDPYDLIDVAVRLPELKAEIDAGGCAEARSELRSMLRRNRDNLPALTLVGLCLMAEAKYAEALPYFTHALEVHPDDPVARANQAGCLLKLGRTAEAEAAYRRVLDRDPAAPEAVANLARLLRERGDLAGAVATVDRAVAAAGAASEAGATAGNPRWLAERGLAHAEAGRFAAALADFLAVVEIRPDDGLAIENAAQAAYHLGRAAQAAALYRRLADLDPSRPGPWKTLGAIQLYELGDPAAARASFARALAVETDPQGRADLTALLAELAPR